MDAVEKYRMRRDARLKKRLDDEWITINGTHVMVDDNKNITKGPAALKNAPKKAPKKGSGKTELERGADRFHKALMEWQDVDFPEDTSEVVSTEEYGKKKDKEDFDRIFHRLHDPDDEAVPGQDKEAEIRDLIESTEHYGPNYQEEAKAWLDSLPEGTEITWGRDGKSGKAVKKADGSFACEDKKGRFTRDSKFVSEWFSNNVTHDLMTDDWDAVGVKVKEKSAKPVSGGEEQRVVGRDRVKKPDKFDVPSNITSKSLKAMKRGDLETFATAIYANKAMESGLSKEEGVRRAKSLMSGNTTAQLIKYIEKNTKRK